MVIQSNTAEDIDGEGFVGETKTQRRTVLKIEQGGIPLYLTTFRAGDFVNGLTKVDAWTPTNKNGYQRMPVEARFRKIARYVQGKEGSRSILPQAIVLNVRDEDAKRLKFTATDGNFGTLRIPADVTLWEVDGQHRGGGLRRAVEENPVLADYPIPVVITLGLARLDEAILFFVINTTQKRVPTDLAQRLIEQQMSDADLRLQIVAEGKDWIPKATKVVDILTATEGHPWYGRIGIPGTKVAGILIKQVSFVSSLKPVLTSVYGSLESDDFSQLLIRYWQALEAIYEEAFADPGEYVIQKTVGVFPLHVIAPQVFDLVRATNARITKDGILDVLKGLDQNLSKKYDAGSAFWHRTEGEAGKYAGAKGFRIIADTLKEYMPEMKKLKII